MNERSVKTHTSIPAFLKNLFCTFPSACILCFTLFLGMTAATSSVTLDAIFSNVLAAFFPGILFAVLGSLITKKCSRHGWLPWATAAAGCLLGYLLRDLHSAYTGMCLAAAFLCVHLAVGKTHREERFGQIAGAFFSSGGLALCLFILLVFCSSAFSLLFFRNAARLQSKLNSSAFYFSMFLVAPLLFLGRMPDESTPPEKRSAFRKFTANLLLPAFLLLTGILLIYIATIIIKWEMPVGQMNWFALAALSFFTLLRLTLTGEESPLSRWFCRWGALLLPPVIIAQQVGVWIRIDAYGLTPARYIGLAITLLLIAVVVLSFFGKTTRWFFAVAAALTLLLTLTPLNAANVSRWSQEARLKTALTECGMLEIGGRIVPNPDADDQHKRVILSSAEYLGYHVDDPPKGSFTEKFLAQFPSSGIVDGYELVFGFSYNSISENRKAETVITGPCDHYSVEVAGFSHAQWFNFTYRYKTMSLSDTSAKSFFVLEDALASVDWDTETLLRSDIPLEDGKIFRISQLRLVSYGGEPSQLYVKGWLLTP